MIYKHNPKKSVRNLKVYLGVLKQCSQIIKFDSNLYSILKYLYQFKKVKVKMPRKVKSRPSRFVKIIKAFYLRAFYVISYLSSFISRFFLFDKSFPLYKKFFYSFIKNYFSYSSSTFLYKSYSFYKDMRDYLKLSKEIRFIYKRKQKSLEKTILKKTFILHFLLNKNFKNSFFLRIFIFNSFSLRKNIIKKILKMNNHFLFKSVFLIHRSLFPKELSSPHVDFGFSFKYSPWFFKDNRYVFFLLVMVFWLFKFYSSFFVFLLRSNFSLWLTFFYSNVNEIFFFEISKYKFPFLYRYSFGNFYFFNRSLVLKSTSKYFFSTFFPFVNILNLMYPEEESKLNISSLGSSSLFFRHLYERVNLKKNRYLKFGKNKHHKHYRKRKHNVMFPFYTHSLS